MQTMQPELEGVLGRLAAVGSGGALLLVVPRGPTALAAALGSLRGLRVLESTLAALGRRAI